MSLRATMNLADWNALLSAAGARVARRREESAGWLGRILPFASWMLVGAVTIGLLSGDPPLLQPAGLMWFFGSILLAVGLNTRIQKRALSPEEQGAFLGEMSWEFSGTGFRARRTNTDAFNHWSLVRDITHTDDHVFLWIDLHSAYVIPARALPAPMTAPELAAHLEQMRATGSAAAPVQPDTPSIVEDPVASSAPTPTPAPVPARLPTVREELAALLKLQSWAVVDGTRLHGRDLTIGALGLFSLLLWIGLDRLAYSSEAEFMWFGVTGLGMFLAATLLLAYVLSRCSVPRLDARRTLLLVAGNLPLFALAGWGASKLPAIVGGVIALLLAGWSLRYFGAGLRSLSGSRQPRALYAGLAAAVVMALASDHVFLGSHLWYEPETPGEAVAGQRHEQLAFEQALRVDQAIQKLPARVSGQSNVYFVGFAGYGEQRVFADEIKLAAARVGTRYHTAGRELLLINDRRDLETHPFASPPALRLALTRLAKLMDVEQDVLFLSLSSHGAEDATITASNHAAFWSDLAASDLRAMLDDAGIRWRVIVISACHSGSFIDALADEHTVILTAAAAERASFGCSDERDLTYFGEAFYRDALPGAANLRAAFDAAKQALNAREQMEMRTPSNPQAHFGAALESKLAEMEKVVPGGQSGNR